MATTRFQKRQSSAISLFSVAGGGEVGSIPIVFDFLVPQTSGLGLLEEEKDVFEDGWDIDIGDYPMAILTQGATCKDPIIELAPHVHVVQSRHARNAHSSESVPTASSSRSPQPSPSASSTLSLPSSNSSADSTPCQSPTTPTSSSPTPRIRPVEETQQESRPSSLEMGQPLKRRPHLRRGGTDPHKRTNSSSTQCEESSVEEPTPEPCNPLSSSLPSRRPQLQSIQTETQRPPSFLWLPPTPVTPTPVDASPRKAAAARWSSPIDWTLVESQLGCQNVEEIDLHSALLPSLDQICPPRPSSAAERRRGFIGTRKNP